MSPSAPPASRRPAPARRLRPLYLVIAMILAWFIGIEGVTSGIDTVSYLREGHVTDVETTTPDTEQDPLQYLGGIYEAAEQAAIVEARQVTFPLNVAKLLLSALLVIASGLAMAGRPGARGVTLQALAANALLIAASYALTRQVRGESIDAVLRAAAALRLEDAQQPLQSPEFWWWVQRTRLAIFDLGALALVGVAMTRPRAKLYFKTMADAVRRAEEEEEP